MLILGGRIHSEGAEIAEEGAEEDGEGEYPQIAQMTQIGIRRGRDKSRRFVGAKRYGWLGEVLSAGFITRWGRVYGGRRAGL